MEGGIGTYWNAMGDDMEKGVALKPGSFFVLPANHTHHTWTTDEEVIVQVTFTLQEPAAEEAAESFRLPLEPVVAKNCCSPGGEQPMLSEVDGQADLKLRLTKRALSPFLSFGESHSGHPTDPFSAQAIS
jgi:hypothetical protein